jgi:hypothetical protein
VQYLVTADGVLEAAFVVARHKCQSDLEPQQEALSRTRQALQENQVQIDTLIKTITTGAASGTVSGDLLGMLNERATQLKMERERLRAEQRRLSAALAPLSAYYDASPVRETLSRFTELAQEAEPSEMQRLLRTTVRRIEWMPDGSHGIEFYALESLQNAQSQYAKSRCGVEPHLDLGLESNQRYGSP